MSALTSRFPPVTALALALATGVAMKLAGAPVIAAPFAAALLFLPDSPWTRPADRLPVAAGLLLVVCAGWAHAAAALDRSVGDCRWTLGADSLAVTGFVTTLDAPGRPRVRVVEGLPEGCRATVRVVVRRTGRPASAPDQAIEPGDRVHLVGRWSPTRRPGQDAGRGDPLWAGVFLAGAAAPAPHFTPAGFERARWTAARMRARIDRALEARLGAEAPLARALVIARRDALQPEVRDAFARSGTAHLLAISGFHVGVVALLAISLLRLTGRSRRAAAGGGALVAVLYAGLLGFPDAATRAAILVALVACGRALGRPVLSVGALSSALLVLLVVDPTGLGRIGFQLSFGGAFGLALLARRLSRAHERWFALAARGVGGARLPPWLGRRWSDARSAVLDGMAASTAATLVTLPLVAWYFETVPILGVWATLLIGPLVAAALPGLLLVVALEVSGLPGAWLPALGAQGLLALARTLAELLAAVPGAAVPVTRPQVVAGLAGALTSVVLLRGARGLGRGVRGAAAAAGAAAALTLLPLGDGAVRGGALEVHVLDVGQGDALALRTPRGRWILIDTGPDPGDRLVRRLRALGVRRVALMVLTHPDLDHIGGAAEVLEAFPVDAVGDPGSVRGSVPFREVLSVAGAQGVPWRVLSRGDTLHLDGVELAVLWPEPLPDAGRAGAAVDPNDRSVVLRVAWGGFSALLTGDAPVAAEYAFGPEAGPVTFLKVGHHGSTTSTGPRLLADVRPEFAVVSAGRYNRFGHPAPAVVARLAEWQIPLYRTDRQGDVLVRVGRRSGVEVRTVD